MVPQRMDWLGTRPESSLSTIYSRCIFTDSLNLTRSEKLHYAVKLFLAESKTPKHCGLSLSLIRREDKGKWSEFLGQRHDDGRWVSVPTVTSTVSYKKLPP